ncbi:MAG: chloride channel protein [Clostridia bacterium]|nr:chloride channel protein [Clostridia bacterium]
MSSYLLFKGKQLGVYAKSVTKLLFFALITGALGGLIGSAFHHSLEFANAAFDSNTWMIWLLPLGGLLIVASYSLTHMLESGGTNDVIDSIRSGRHLRLIVAPLIFISTFLTHLLGGSSGREGAALQLGGSIGVQVGKRLHLGDRDLHLLTLCGMSAFFSALFCTPLTAVFFGIEVVSVGVMYYVALLPCIGSSLLAYAIATALGSHPISFTAVMPSYSPDLLWRVAILSVLCAAVSIVYCITMRETSKGFKKLFPNPVARILVGSFVIIMFTYLCRSNDYNGAGMDIVYRAINEGTVHPSAFLWKIVFTAVTIGCGFKGGEIVPTMFIGATLGGLAGPFLGMDPGFAAAVGLVAFFCGSVNCPVTSILLSVELFGANALLLFAPSCIISYILSGNFSLYHAQKIVYAKLQAEWINRPAK